MEGKAHGKGKFTHSTGRIWNSTGSDGFGCSDAKWVQLLHGFLCWMLLGGLWNFI